MMQLLVLYFAIGFLIAAVSLSLLDDAPIWAKVICFLVDLFLWPLHLFVAGFIWLEKRIKKWKK